MQKTTNYQLNQWEATDQVRRTDFNADNARIDAALAGLARVEVGSYVGTGTYGETNPNTLTFSFPPKVVFISASFGGCMASGFYLIRGQTASAGVGTCSSGSGVYNLVISWSENSVTWYSITKTAEKQLNIADRLYSYCAIG